MRVSEQTIGAWTVRVYQWEHGGYGAAVMRGRPVSMTIYWEGGDLRGEEYPSPEVAFSEAIEWLRADCRKTLADTANPKTQEPR